MRRHLALIVGLLTIPALLPRDGAGPIASLAAFQQGTFEVDDPFVSGLSRPTAMEFAPDGRLFVTQQSGSIRIVTADGQLLSTPFLTLSNIVSDRENGLLGLAFDPDFASNGHVYIYYTPDGLTRLSRVTANGNLVVPNSEVIIFQYAKPPSTHRGGDIHFGPDGKLYVAIGDGHTSTDAQQVTNFNGKILRLNKDGSIPSDNPTSFRSTSGATLTPTGQYRAIWAIGLRNPYRFAIDPATGRMHINDVGQEAWEEVNLGGAGRNYGWPTCEGTCTNTYVTQPFYVYPDCAVTGGTFYDGAQFPATYTGSYFIIDYCNSWLRRLRSDNTWETVPVQIPESSVDLKTAPDGSLYVLGHGSGRISRISYTGSGANRNPVAQASATPASGSAPLTVSFSGAASSDPDGDPLSYAWTFGDSTSGTGVSVTHTYASIGTYLAELTVSDGRGGSHSRELTIVVGTPPTATITSPQQGASYTAGQTIAFSATANDSSGAALPASAYSWNVLFHHDTHTHPMVGPINGVTSGSFVVPTTGHTEHTVFYRIYLTVTDSSGLRTTVTRDVTPRTASITLSSNIVGAQILLDGSPRQAPFTFIGVVGVPRTIEVVSPQSVNGQQYQFVRWSNSGSRRQTITTPASNTTYVATLQGPPAPPGNVRIVR